VDILNGEGYKGFAVSDGNSAIKWAEMLLADVVITDVIMPGIDGIEAAKRILKLLPNCRIILFSGQAASSDLLEKAKAEGFAFEMLAKPINPELLLEKLRNSPTANAESAAV
jgi:CheY-like chemotaxis protein